METGLDVQNRETFAVRQAEMSDGWYRRLLARGGDVQAHIAKRHAAYLDRWREACRFVGEGDRLLDIGGGSLYPELVQFIVDRKINYWYLDIDPGIANNSSLLAQQHGIDASHFNSGFNDKLSYSDASFDAVFSSHCIEHSFDLSRTFCELHRVIRSGGTLLMAVPLGWENNPEHPYFFGPNEWLTIVEDAGFGIRIAQLGREYPEEGYDLFIAARRLDEIPVEKRVDPENYRKTNFSLITHDDPAIIFDCDVDHCKDGAICRGDWKINWTAPVNTREIIPLMVRHQFSGIVETSIRTERAFCDLFSWTHFTQSTQAVFADPDRSAEIVIRPVGRNPLSRGDEGVLAGFLYR